MRRVASPLAVAVLLLLILETQDPTPAPAGPAASPACPEGIPDDGFPDVPSGSAHERSIDCIAFWGITVGRDGGFAPQESVTRGQIASFLLRTVEALGRQLPEQRADFRDLAGGPHRRAIEVLGSLDIVEGDEQGRYRAGDPASRAMMAAAVVRTFEYLVTPSPDPPVDAFADIADSPFRRDINRAAALGITEGVGDGRFAPGQPVPRGQMATFLVRLLDRLLGEGVGTPRPAPAREETPGSNGSSPQPIVEHTAYDFLMPLGDGAGVGWDPCKPIPVVANFAGAPSFAASALEEALDKLAAGLGMTVRYQGTTRARLATPQERWQKPNLLVNWPETWTLRGMWGSARFRAMDDRIISASVSINRQIDTDHEGLVAILMHELGHAVGLAHVDDPTQVMAASGPPGPHWGDGDLAGLARLGQLADCPA